MPSAPQTPNERFAPLLQRLGETADACPGGAQGRLMAMLINLIREIILALAGLATEIREGEIALPTPAPHQRNESPAPREAQQTAHPKAERSIARTRRAQKGATASSSENAESPAQSWPGTEPPRHPKPRRQAATTPSPTHWPPWADSKPKTAAYKPAPWHAHFIPYSE